MVEQFPKNMHMGTFVWFMNIAKHEPTPKKINLKRP